MAAHVLCTQLPRVRVKVRVRRLGPTDRHQRAVQVINVLSGVRGERVTTTDMMQCDAKNIVSRDERVGEH